MKKIEFFKDQQKIDEQVKTVDRFCRRLEKNMERLKKLNRIFKTFDVEFIFDICKEANKVGLKDYVRKKLPVGTPSEVEGRMNYFIRAITEYGWCSELDTLFEKEEKLEVLSTPVVGERKMRKGDLSFDYGSNKVVPTPELIEEINEAHTHYLETATQKKVFDLAKDVVSILSQVVDLYKENNQQRSVLSFVESIITENFEKDPGFDCKNFYEYILPDFK
ncbi:MAG: hypothetical protein BGO34_16960 [Bacteroidia bacterium 44-10]|nr:MAG: hypothetical protein BGO34_16960 [Bacteroidia bacterium 44-10]